jgi:hypothetical protein
MLGVDEEDDDDNDDDDYATQEDAGFACKRRQ